MGNRVLTRAKRFVPRRLKDEVLLWRVASDSAGRRTLWRLLTHQDQPGPPVTIRVKPLGGAPFVLRPGTTDAYIVRESFAYGGHMPPPELRDIRLVVDVGANIGTSMAEFAHSLSAADVIGIEPDPGNAALCRQNVAPWPRCEVVEAALWTQDGQVQLAGAQGREAGLRVAEAGAVTVDALSLPTFLERHAADRPVDYMKLDIEGGEQPLLGEPDGWDRVRSVGVEVHPPYTVEGCVSDLRALGFETRVDRRHVPQQPTVVGVRG